MLSVKAAKAEMPYSRRLLLQENCFVEPICLSPSAEDAELVVYSQKVAERPELTRITVLFVVDDSILHETVLDLPLSRVTVPARLLSAVGSITVHLAVCDATGVTDVIDSGQVLVLPPDSARELQHVFEQMTLDVQDSFYSPTPHSSHAERFRQNPPPWSHLLPVHEPVPAVSAAPGNEADTRTVSAAEARNAALYSYQHLLLPVVHLMSAVLQGAAAHHRGLSSHRETAALQNIARRLLDFLVDNDMFESAMYFMAQLPFAPEDAMGNRLQLFNSLAGHSSVRALVLQQPLQQQLLTLRIAQQHTADSLRELQIRNSVMPVMDLQEQQQQHSEDLAATRTSAGARAAGQQLMLQQRSSDGSSIASADEILRQLGALGQVRCEQEALESELLLQEELDALDSAYALQQQRELEQHLQQQQQQRQSEPPQQQQQLEQHLQLQQQQLEQHLKQQQLEQHLQQQQQQQLNLPQQQQPSELSSGVAQPAATGSVADEDDCHLHRCSSVPWSFHSMQKSPQQLGFDAHDYAAVGPSGTTRASDAAMGTAASSLAVLGFGQSHQIRQSRAIPDELEGYLQPHPSLIRRSLPQRPLAAVQQSPGVRGSTRSGSLELPPRLRQPMLVPMLPVPLSSSAAGTVGGGPRGVQQQRAGTLGAAVADGQRLQLHLHLEPGLPAVVPAAMTAVPAVGQQFHQQREQLLVQQQQQPQQQQRVSMERMQLTPVSAAAKQSESPNSSGSGSFKSIDGLSGQPEPELAEVSAVQADVPSNTNVGGSICGANDGPAAAATTNHTQQHEAIPEASCSSSKAASSSFAAATAFDKSPFWFDGLPTSQRLRALARASVNGFHDQHQEQAFLMFKNHSAGLLDTTAAVICLGMLVAASLRSLNPQDPLVWQKLAVILVYGLAFFFPYAFMHLKKQAFLRFREPLLVWARVLSSCVLILVGLGIVARPDAWVAAVGRCVGHCCTFLTLHLQNGFILPCCQQVRVPAAFVIAAAQLLADACLLQMEFAPWIAVLEAACIQACALVVGLWVDAWGRKRFILRFRGMFGQQCL